MFNAEARSPGAAGVSPATGDWNAEFRSATLAGGETVFSNVPKAGETPAVPGEQQFVNR